MNASDVIQSVGLRDSVGHHDDDGGNGGEVARPTIERLRSPHMRPTFRTTRGLPLNNPNASRKGPSQGHLSFGPSRLGVGDPEEKRSP